MMRYLRVPILVLLSLTIAGACAAQDLVNLAPFAHVSVSARTDGCRDGDCIIDEDPKTYWSAWPYTIRGPEDIITLEVHLLWPSPVSAIEVDYGCLPDKASMFLLEDGKWRPHDAEYERTNKGQRFTWPTPRTISGMIVETDEAIEHLSARRAAPTWAIQYTEGLKAWRDIIYYWIDRQAPNGTFGFGWGEDCEMTVGWPGVMMAADDKRIEESLSRMCEDVWFSPAIQNGFQWMATDAEHGPESISYTYPVMLYQQFGSPRLIERCMITSKNVEYWTGITPRGDRHMKSTYFGSQQLYDWPFYDEDSPINARAWLPMIHLALYNRDPHLLRYLTEWADSWVRHAQETDYGKPYGFLPGQVAFPTGEPGGHTRNWWGAGAHVFSSLWYQTRLNELLVVAYVVTGDEKYLIPLRGMFDFMTAYARPEVARGEPLPLDRLPKEFTFPAGWREGPESTRWARDLGWGHFLNWYYYITGDRSYDKGFGDLFGEEIKRGPFQRIDKGIVERGHRRAISYRDDYFRNVLPTLRKEGDSTANYAAAFWQKQYGTMTFGQRCFRDGGRLANSVNWPWVDFPPPSVVWKDTGYTTGIFVLQDDPQVFRGALCNLADHRRRIGAQLFTLDEGTYQLLVGPDVDENGVMDRVSRRESLLIERGLRVDVTLEPNVTTLLELRRDKGSGPVPRWRPRADLGLDDWDVMSAQPDSSGRTTVTVRVHNIGTRTAQDFEVRLLGKTSLLAEAVELSRAAVPRLDAPEKLDPSWVDVAFELNLPEHLDSVGVVLDPDDAVDELCESNNSVWVRLRDLRSEQREKRLVQHEPAKRPSLEDVDTAGLAKYVVPFRGGIALDGEVDAAEWEGVQPFDFIPHAAEGAPKKPTKMRMACDNEALYLSFVCDEPDMDMLDTELKDIHDIYYKDGFEIFLDPGAEVWRYWQFAFTTAPHKFQTQTRNEFAPKAEWDVAVFKGEDFWSAEVRFPFASFGRGKPADGERWRLNAMRYTTTFTDPKDPDRRASERSHFSPLGRLRHHHTPKLFGDIYFRAEPATASDGQTAPGSQG